MSNLYLYKRPAEQIIYHTQTKLQTQIPDDLRHDIYSNVLEAVLVENELAISGKEYWKEEYTDLKKKQFPLKWNELRIKLARMKTKEADEVLDLMWRLDDGQSIR